MTAESDSKRRVSYFYDAEVGNYHYGQGHPMKPHRVRCVMLFVIFVGHRGQRRLLVSSGQYNIHVS
ncbi:hypothetical protein ACHAWO_003670 [Cyclotella atomus]|uniref:Histone deacetylase n=1 Tax=Cyclotella atomus TaxID=382360 RepID=A0ABD3PH20_9STRA